MSVCVCVRTRAGEREVVILLDLVGECQVIHFLILHTRGSAHARVFFRESKKEAGQKFCSSQVMSHTHTYTHTRTHITPVRAVAADCPLYPPSVTAHRHTYTLIHRYTDTHTNTRTLTRIRIRLRHRLRLRGGLGMHDASDAYWNVKQPS